MSMINIRKILKEESEIPYKIRRRLDFNNMERLFEKHLEESAIKFIKNKTKWTHMSLSAFRSIIISGLIVELYEDESLGEEMFDEIWEFLSDYYRERIEDKFTEVKS